MTLRTATRLAAFAFVVLMAWGFLAAHIATRALS